LHYQEEQQHIDFVISINGILVEGFEAYVKKVEKSCMDYGFHMVVTTWNEGVARDMEILVKKKVSIPSNLIFHI
jgi:dihydropyrimidinase